jgi:hypothetical protein
MYCIFQKTKTNCFSNKNFSKEKALAEAAALLVLAKKYRALPQQDEDI